MEEYNLRLPLQTDVNIIGKEDYTEFDKYSAIMSVERIQEYLSIVQSESEL